MDCLHTILLGAYKYLLSELLERLTASQKQEVSASINAFPQSSIVGTLSGNITRYHRSCVGRDFKALAQMAPFVLWRHLNTNEREIWLLLSKVKTMDQIEIN